jgi:mRNA-degrading endonuclease YafQ of YafQ-DinJ toxin-antitoxin module
LRNITIWDIQETKFVRKNWKGLPSSVQKKYRAWIEIAKNGGSKNLKKFSGLNDEALKGKLKDFRSSRLDIKYRVIYKEDKKKNEILVKSLTAHNYK